MVKTTCVSHFTDLKTGHGRSETRTYVQLPVPQTLAGVERWASLKTLGVVISIIVREGKETMDIRYFISSLELGVK